MKLVCSRSIGDRSTKQEDLASMNSHSFAAFFLWTIGHFSREFSPQEALQIEAMERTTSRFIFVLSSIHIEHAAGLGTGAELIPWRAASHRLFGVPFFSDVIENIYSIQVRGISWATASSTPHVYFSTNLSRYMTASSRGFGKRHRVCWSYANNSRPTSFYTEHSNRRARDLPMSTECLERVWPPKPADYYPHTGGLKGSSPTKNVIFYKMNSSEKTHR